MRIASKTLYDRMVGSLGSAYSDMFKAQQVASSGKKINKLSDDPVSLVSVLDMRAALSNLDQMNNNVSMGKSWLTSSETALTQVNDILSKTKELTVQMSSSTEGAPERANAVSLVDGYLNQIISLANSQSGGRYLFGGLNTEERPFETTTNASGTQVVNYNGDGTPFSIKISNDSSVAIGKSGADIFGENWDDSNIFKSLIDLKTALQSNDVSGIQHVMGNLDNHMLKVNAEISDIGGKATRMNVRENVIADLKLNYTNRKSELEDADISEALINLNSKQLAYNAALTASSKVMGMSLVDYLS
jgi:flagellar hook-associated protein 3 FlgL